MKALVLSGGNGTRLRPFTYSIPKQLVPIAGRPVLEHVLDKIVELGVTEIGVIVGDGEAQIAAAIGDGSRFGAQVTYLRQDKPLGLAHCIRVARDFLGDDDFVLYLGDNFLLEGVGAIAEEFRATRPAAQLVVRTVPDPRQFGVAELGENGRVARLEEKPRVPRSDLALVGVYFFTPAIHAAVAAIRPSRRGELEITDAISVLIDTGEIVRATRYDGYWRDTGQAEDVLDCNRRLLDTMDHGELLGSVDAVSELSGPVLLGAGAKVVRSRLEGPIVVGEGTVIEDSDLGPHTALGRNCAVRGSLIAGSVVFDDASITGVPALRDSLIGRYAHVGTRASGAMSGHRLVIGDHADVQLPVGPPFLDGVFDRPAAAGPAVADRPLSPREDIGLPRRLADSAALRVAGADISTVDSVRWLSRRGEAHDYRVDRIPFGELDGWAFQPDTGNLGHHTGRFFTVEGLDISVAEDGRSWQQPIIVQPEIGILGILAKEFDGVLHFLMQAKMEPGNSPLFQLSPTVQATRSNFNRVHQGAGVRYLEYFTDASLGRPIVDTTQSEHGSWFYRKSNRNMIVEVSGDVPTHEDFRWLTLGQIAELLHHDNLVNMDSRTVLACAPGARPEAGVRHPDTEVLSWFTAEKSRYDIQVSRKPLTEVEGWVRGDSVIERPDGRFFRVMAVSAHTSSREVSSWTQPMIEPVGVGVAAFLVRSFHGVPHLLVHARVEGGFLDVVELGPTVQYTPEHYTHLRGPDRPPFHDLVVDAPPSRIRYEGIHSEEGGRFFHAKTRYLFLDADEHEAPADPPGGYRWMTPGQLSSLVRHGHYVNVQARSLLALLTTRAVEL
jgi:oxidase EvaA